MTMEHDQARRLRELVREARTGLSSENRAPVVVAVAGGGLHVGATTVVKLLVAEFSRKSMSIKLLHANEDLISDNSGADIILIEAGPGYSDRTASIWQQADMVLLVTTDEQEAVLATYSTLKRAKAANHALPVCLVANRSKDVFAAEVLYQRLSDSCRRFLDCSISRAPWLPICNENEESSATDTHVARLAQFILSQTSSALARASKQAA